MTYGKTFPRLLLIGIILMEVDVKEGSGEGGDASESNIRTVATS